MNKKIADKIIFTFLLLSSLWTSAQNIKIKGVLHDNLTKDVVMFADVQLKLNDSIVQTTLTDRDGIFIFKDLIKQNYSLKICAVCYPCIDNYTVDFSLKLIDLYLKDYKRPESIYQKSK